MSTVTRTAKGSALTGLEYDRNILAGGGFPTVAALLSNTVNYSFPSGNIVQAGAYRYQVMASNATNHHVTTTGGVRLRVLPNDQNEYPAEAFGAPISTGVWNDAALRSAVKAGYTDGVPVRFGPGEWRPTSRIFLQSNSILRGTPGRTRIIADPNTWVYDGFNTRRHRTVFHLPARPDVSPTPPGISLGPHSNVHLSDLIIHGAKGLPNPHPGSGSSNAPEVNGAALLIEHVRGFSIRGCRITSSADSGIYITGYGAVSYSSPSSESHLNDGGSWGQTWEGIVEGNYVTGSRSGIEFEGGVRRSVIRNNWCAGNVHHGVRITSAIDCEIVGNYSDANNGWAIWLDRSRNMIIRGNQDHNSPRSLVLQNSMRTTVEGNIFSNYVMFCGNFDTNGGIFEYRDGVFSNNQWSRNNNNPVLRIQRGSGEGGQPSADNGMWIVTGNRLQPTGSIRVRDGLRVRIFNNSARLHSDTLAQTSVIHGNNWAP